MPDPTEAELINQLSRAKLALDRTGGERMMRDALQAARPLMSSDAIAETVGMFRADLAAIVPE
jgi:hypothetical protein